MSSPSSAVARSKPSPGFWSSVWKRFRRNWPATIALAFVALMGVTAVFAPAIVGSKPVVCRYKGQLSFPCLGYYRFDWEEGTTVSKEMRKRYSPEKLKAKDPDSWAIWPLVFQDPYRQIREGERGPDSPANTTGGPPDGVSFFGTTSDGIDVFAQIVHGARVALLVGFVATGISAAIGIVLGALAGYYGGWVDNVVSRTLEVVMCVPTLVLILALIAVFRDRTVWHTMAVLGATGWPGIARLTRAEFLKLKNLDYVMAARAMGAGPLRIIFRHILPNSLAPVLVPISFGIAGAVLTENALAFLGFGAPPPYASWGNVLQQGSQNLEMWWLIVFPGTAVFLTVLAYNLIGEGLQEATDPRLRESTK